jgi:glycosyltransferase domain-containing protein
MMQSELLTLVIPTQNRARYCLAQLRFFRSCGFKHRIVVADSSDHVESEAVRAGCAGLADYLRVDRTLKQYEQFAWIVRAIDTPYVVLTPDDDIAFPHAIEAALAYLQAYDDHVAVHGYSLRFGMHGPDVDIYTVEHFIPTIGEDNPIQRLYHLMRRFQPHLWAVFRTDAYASAIERAAAINGTVFQELLFLTISILKGKVARLPMIYAMRGPEISRVDPSEFDPFQWFLKDAESFFKHYIVYRNAVVDFIRRSLDCVGVLSCNSNLQIHVFHQISVEQIIDLINATFLGRTLDLGVVNYNVRWALGEMEQPFKFPPPWAGWKEPIEGDLIHPSSKIANRRYVWRRAVIEAEPKQEITISAEEMSRVATQLDQYRF